MSVDDQDTREFYTRPAAMTSLGENAPLRRCRAIPALSPRCCTGW